jgi:hypothetical protein
VHRVREGWRPYARCSSVGNERGKTTADAAWGVRIISMERPARFHQLVGYVRAAPPRRVRGQPEVVADPDILDEFRARQQTPYRRTSSWKPMDSVVRVGQECKTSSPEPEHSPHRAVDVGAGLSNGPSCQGRCSLPASLGGALQRSALDGGCRKSSETAPWLLICMRAEPSDAFRTAPIGKCPVATVVPNGQRRRPRALQRSAYHSMR